MRLFRTRTYARALKRLAKLGATDQDIASMEAAIASDPKQGAVIRGSGGVRKVRFAYGRAGKSGGGRVIYYFLAPSEAIYLIDAYAKVDQSDISADDIKAYHAMLKDLSDG